MELSFTPSVNLFNDVDYRRIILQTVWGDENQMFDASYNGPDAPEPSEFSMIGAGVVALMVGIFQKRHSAAVVRRIGVQTAKCLLALTA